MLKVVDLINNASMELRPAVLVSATAIGYYGMQLVHLCLQYFLLACTLFPVNFTCFHVYENLIED